jgi:hypothetical protein
LLALLASGEQVDLGCTGLLSHQGFKHPQVLLDHSIDLAPQYFVEFIRRLILLVTGLKHQIIV